MYWDALNDFEGRSLWWQWPDIQPKSWNMDTRFAACGMSVTDTLHTVPMSVCISNYIAASEVAPLDVSRDHPFRIFPVGKIQSFLPIIAACLCYLLSMLVNCQHCILQRIWWKRLEMEMIPSPGKSSTKHSTDFPFWFLRADPTLTLQQTKRMTRCRMLTIILNLSQPFQQRPTYRPYPALGGNQGGLRTNHFGQYGVSAGMNCPHTTYLLHQNTECER